MPRAVQDLTFITAILVSFSGVLAEEGEHVGVDELNYRYSIIIYTRGGPCQHGFMSGSKQ